ncbi:MAG TPA: glycosyltransferase family 2 protein [Desulfobacteraceae bacterium]|nr:glycosyltransferase family 2 protein [Desulfobacteraceae bacterium]
MSILIFILFFSIFLVFYAYFGYPLTLLFLRYIKGRNHYRDRISLPVTLIITVFNEEKRIREKLENTLQLEYSGGTLEVLVASDGSTDATNSIVAEFTDRGIGLLNITPRSGKENAQKVAVQHANGEILVFSDVATRLDSNAIQEIVANFADPSVGCVSSEDRLLNQDGQPSGEGLYVRYEMWLRRLESSVNSLVGLSGSFFAARKEVCRDFSGDVQSDFRTLLSSIKLGLRGVSDPAAIGYYLDVANEKYELERKVRTVVRGITVFFGHLEFLNPFRYGLFAYQFFCHKLLRWLVPFFLISALVANVCLALNSFFFQFLLFGQLLFYGLGILSWKTQKLHGLLKTPMFFLIVNAAIFIAWIKYLKGERIVQWTPSQR